MARTRPRSRCPLVDLRLALETDDAIIYTGEQFVHQIFGAGDLPALRLLLERHPDALRCLPLCGSMYPRWRDGLELLFAFGFGPDLRDWLGKTMLHCAAMENDVEAAALMLERGADINAVEAEDRATPLAMAARRGHEEMVIFLLERGADAGLPAEEWARPATVARDAGHEEIASLIERSTA
jgi:ankyrin repeat protein